MTQYFGSALQVTPHFHSLVPDGVFVEAPDGTVTFVALPPPTPEEVATLARRFVKRAHALLDKHGVEGVDLFPDDALEALRLASLQTRLPLNEDVEARPPRALHGRVAVVDGFSLHADTAVHAHDRAGLERLARYGLRGPLALERLTLRDDGLVEYRLRKASPSGRHLLVLSPGAFLKRVIALLPPPRRHLLHFHGCLAPHARVRSAVVALARPAGESTSSSPTEAPPGSRTQTAPSEPPTTAKAPKRPRLDWAELLRKSFALDVFLCASCGARRRVVAVINHRDTARRVLLARGLPADAPPTGPPRPRPQLDLAL